MTPAVLIAILLVKPFLHLWISPEFAINANGTAQILLLGYWINGLARVPFAQVQAMGRPDVTAKFHLIEFIPYLFFAKLLPRAIAILKSPTILLIGALGAALGLSVGGTIWWLAAVSLSITALAWSWQSAPVELRELVIRLVLDIPEALR